MNLSAVIFCTVFYILLGCLSAAPPSSGKPTLINPLCLRQTFRQLSGRCTSSANPTWGAAGIPYSSYFRNHDSRTPKGQNLKSARLISNILSAQSKDTVNQHRLNEFWSYFNLFLAHELIKTPDSDEPFNVPLPSDDPFFPPGTQLVFRRYERIRTGEGLNERPINTVSSALDLSGVYGIDKDRNKAIRMPGSAKLRTMPGNLLPLNTDGLPNLPDSSPNFYLAGDTRANESPILLILHTIFVREHNRLVGEINSHLPFLSKRKLYQYAKKINIAQYQKIVLEEFYEAFVSRPLPKYKGYNPTANPSITDVYAVVGAAFGINMLGRTVNRKRANGSSLPPIMLAESINRNATENPVTSKEIDNFIRGVTTTISQENDLQVQDDFRNIFEETPFGNIGLDLFALPIQRARDVGLPTYNEMRKIFGLAPLPIDKISSDANIVAGLKSAYDGKADDIDLWVGILAEDKMARSGVGETAALIWSQEFTRLRDGDQFSYLRRSKIPKILRRNLSKRLKDLCSDKKDLLRKIIIRNTGVTREQLPRGSLFRV